MLDKSSRCVVRGGEQQGISVPTEDVAEVGLTDACSLVQYGSENRLKVIRRARYDAQHVGRRRLLLQRLAKFGEQPRILEGDHRLIGKGLHQLDLLGAERAHRLAAECKHAN